MVGATGQGTGSIKTCRKPISHEGLEKSLPVSSTVNAEEECEGGWVWRSGGGEGGTKRLDSHMDMTNDVSVGI